MQHKYSGPEGAELRYEYKQSSPSALSLNKIKYRRHKVQH